MKILWVKAGELVPPDTGGKIRSYNILRQLGGHHDVTLFLFYGAHEQDTHEQLQRMLHEVILIPLKLPAPRGGGEFLSYLRHLFAREPYNLNKYCRSNVRGKLGALLKTERFDVILCDFLVTAGVIPWDAPGLKILFTHNVEAVIWRRHYETSKDPLWKALSWYEWKRMEAAERRYLARADHVLVVSEKDQETFSNFIPCEKMSVIQTGTDIDFFRPSGETEIPNSMVFTGSMDWLPNEDAIVHFVEEILPFILARRPEATFYVVGRKPSRRLRELASRVPSLRLTGWVEDVRPYVAQSAVYVVPLRIAGGTRLKIFEAMSMAKAVVSTSIGAEGLPVENGKHLILADDPVDFANRVLMLFDDAVQRETLGEAARELVAENYGWSSIAADFTRVLANVAQPAK